MCCWKAPSAWCRWRAMHSTFTSAPTGATSRCYASISRGRDIRARSAQCLPGIWPQGDWRFPERSCCRNDLSGLFPVRLVARFFLAVGTDNALDLDRGLAGFLGNLAVLLDQEAVRRLVAVDAAGERARHFAVRALRTVLIDDVEHDEFGILPGLARHGCSPQCWSAI